MFYKDITGITQTNNVLKAMLLDASNTILATSDAVNFTKGSGTGSVYGVTISPSNNVATSTPIIISVEAVSGLAEVTVTLDGTILKATESGSQSGKYTVATVAPSSA